MPDGTPVSGTVEDKGGAIKGLHLDIWCENHADAIKNGTFTTYRFKSQFIQRVSIWPTHACRSNTQQLLDGNTYPDGGPEPSRIIAPMTIPFAIACESTVVQIAVHSERSRQWA